MKDKLLLTKVHVAINYNTLNQSGTDRKVFRKVKSPDPVYCQYSEKAEHIFLDTPHEALLLVPPGSTKDDETINF